ncbi:ArsR/SmtB family transcription factor [Paenibacillus sp. 481]|uniref:ArsR/SmtB family transcription factor n=1 Tax=Paenibacillus sp. 481 TaxID=2835869 RepID=UPI001E47D333|nr:winged helix-turn-helix domain-containing protein [Paenibacillus sp. 481]UHA73351.1 winged helix-turn-helix transcriptional regulator [Paenibacillus sp. 481]
MTSEHEWLLLFEALANPIRLKIIASLHGKRKYVSELAREVGINIYIYTMEPRSYAAFCFTHH